MQFATPEPTNWKERAVHPRTLLGALGGVALALAGTGLWWQYTMKPQKALSDKRVQSTLNLAKMYALQLSYKKSHGTYANDLASLLTVSPDAAALKASLAANADMNTLAVVGDADKFKIELNVQDPERTLIKVRGPVAPKVVAKPAVLPTQAPPMNADGAPVDGPTER